MLSLVAPAGAMFALLLNRIEAQVAPPVRVRAAAVAVVLGATVYEFVPLASRIPIGRVG